MMLLETCVVIILLCVVVIIAFPHLAYWWSRRYNPHVYENVNGKYPTVAFFHPYCNAGGGGERVLWVAILALQQRYPGITCIVYTGDTDSSPGHILLKARDRFNIHLPHPVKFVFLTTRHLVEARHYPHFTLLGQSMGSVILALEALFKFVPDIYIDSMGYAFTIPIFRFLGSAVTASYVHYATISTDMLSKVSDKIASFNNASFISSSPFLTNTKLLYYKLFAFLYGLCGKCNSAVMVNSTWTYNHVCSLWRCEHKTTIVHPPCDIEEFTQIPLKTHDQSQMINTFVSIAQFRPEKDHPLQVRSFARFLNNIDVTERNKYKLILVGSCRNSEDSDRVAALEQLSRDLKIDEKVEIKLNVRFEELKSLLSQATIGLHTMRDEHFGIGVVECMAAGAVTLAHNSGGPKLDIVTPHGGHPTGYLADSEETYADCMRQICDLTVEKRRELCENARNSVARFSDTEFKSKFISIVEPIISKFD